VCCLHRIEERKRREEVEDRRGRRRAQRRLTLTPSRLRNATGSKGRSQARAR